MHMYFDIAQIVKKKTYQKFIHPLHAAIHLIHQQTENRNPSPYLPYPGRIPHPTDVKTGGVKEKNIEGAVMEEERLDER